MQTNLGTEPNTPPIVPEAAPAVPLTLLAFPWGRLIIGLVVVVIIGLLAVTQGSVDIPFIQVIRIAMDHLPGVSLEQTWPQSWDSILWQLRFPRVLLAGLVGAALAMSGATYQGLFRNPLADPYLMGVASGAGLGATIVLVSPVPAYLGGFSVVPMVAFAGALVAVALTYSLARVDGMVPVTTLILAGVAVAALAGALTTFLMMIASDDVRPILWWLLGSFNGSAWRDLLLLVPYLLLATLTILFHSRILNVLQLDREQAAQLGVNVERTTMLLVIAASLATAVAVAVSGPIGFVGLIAPHAVRLVWGPNYRSLLPISMLMGAGFLILADLGARTALRPGELPVGVITALCGAPFFLYLLRRANRRGT